MKKHDELYDFDPAELTLPAFSIWEQRNLLLTAGDFSDGQYNPMTVGWGFFGVMWRRPVAVVAVRPQRHTMRLLERFDSFTLSVLPEAYRAAIAWCGSHSGADGDKFAGAGLTPVESRRVGAPSVGEAEFTVECRQLYAGQLAGKNFHCKPIVADCYPERDFHWMIYGEIVTARGTAAYRRNEK